MKTNFENFECAGVIDLDSKALCEINGGSFWDDLGYAAGYAAHVVVAFIQDNIEHPIGAAGGYPPR